LKIKIGIDEVGRGCLAGPVTVSAVSVSQKFKKPSYLPELRDSKMMTRLQREAWHKWMKEEGKSAGIYIATSSVMPKTVDRINIAKAANLAAWRVLNKLLFYSEDLEAEVTLDGSLFLKSRLFQEKKIYMPQILTVRTVPKADRKFTEVKLAAVWAKVSRDAYMRRADIKYPEFGFKTHKGYGTRAHIRAIMNEGVIVGFHRETFLGKIMLN